MQSIFLACYFCLQLIALHSQDQTALHYRDSSCDQCLTGVVENLHLSSDLAAQVEDWLSIKKPSTEILSSNPDLAEAIAKLVQEQIVPTTENPTDEEQQKPNGFLGKVVDSLVKPKPKGRSFLRINERIMAGESLVSENQKYLATLNDHGDLMLTDVGGNFIEQLGCTSEEPSQDYNMLFHSSNSVRFYKKVEANSDNYYCSSGIPLGCTQQGVRCYLNLDNDGRLRFYSGDGHFEYYYSNQPEPTTSGNLPENDTPEPQQPSGAENSQEIEYKGPSTLKRNQRLKVGEFLVSENGKFKITLNRQGQFETFDSYGELIRNSGSCDNSLPSSDTWNVMMHSDNSRRLYRDLDRDANDYACSSGIPWGCTLSGVECYLKLDDDGILKIFDDKGQVEMEFTFNKLDSP